MRRGVLPVDSVTLRLSVVETATEWVVICESPLGSTNCHLPAPFSGADLDTALRELETSIVRSSAKVVTRRATPPERIAREFGRRLTEVLLAGDARVIFDRCRTQARHDRSAMRILLSTDGPRVSEIPWEFAVDPQVQDDYLALRLSLARSPRVSEPVPPLHVDPPLRVLGVQARPHDLPQLDADQEREHIAAAFATVSSDLVDVTWLPGDGWRDISNALSSRPWHVLHFVGHGGFNQELESGYLELSDERGQAMRVPATDIGRAVARCPQLRLVVINACESASTGTAGVFASTAAKLMNEGIPAVVAMQYEITDPAALAFAATFYEAIAHGTPVDRAVTMARETLKVTLGSLEWATPVLFLASPETRIFQVSPQTSPGSVVPPQQPPSRPVPEPRPPSAPSQSDRKEWTTELRGRLEQFLQSEPAPQPAPHAESPAGPAPVTPPMPAWLQHVASPRTDLPQLRRLDASTPVGGSRKAAVGPDGLVAVICADDSLRIWSTTGRREVSHCVSPTAAPVLLAWSPWRRHVATANLDGSVVVWDLEREVPQLVVRPGWPQIFALAFSASGRWIAVAGPDRQVQVYGTDGVLARRFAVEGSRHAALGLLSFVPGDRRLVAALDDGTVYQVDVQGGIRQSWPHPVFVTTLATSDDRLATCMPDGRLRLWTWDGRLVHRSGRTTPTPCLGFAPDGSYLVAAGNDQGLTVLSPDGAELAHAVLAGRPVGAGAGADAIVTVTDGGVVERWAPPPIRGSWTDG
jgi:CHAT domain